MRYVRQVAQPDGAITWQIMDVDRQLILVFCSDCREHLLLDVGEIYFLLENRIGEAFACKRCRDRRIESGLPLTPYGGLAHLEIDRETLLEALEMLGAE